MRLVGTPDRPHVLGGELRRGSSAYVLGARNRLEMVRVDARRIAAQVIKLQALGDWAALAFVEDAMRARHHTVVRHLSVAVAVTTVLPHPAPVVVHDVVRPDPPSNTTEV